MIEHSCGVSRLKQHVSGGYIDDFKCLKFSQEICLAMEKLVLKKIKLQNTNVKILIDKLLENLMMNLKVMVVY